MDRLAVLPAALPDEHRRGVRPDGLRGAAALPRERARHLARLPADGHRRPPDAGIRPGDQSGTGPHCVLMCGEDPAAGESACRIPNEVLQAGAGSAGRRQTSAAPADERGEAAAQSRPLRPALASTVRLVPPSALLDARMAAESGARIPDRLR